jgi:HEPN domain-containing protein
VPKQIIQKIFKEALILKIKKKYFTGNSIGQLYQILKTLDKNRFAIAQNLKKSAILFNFNIY